MAVAFLNHCTEPKRKLKHLFLRAFRVLSSARLGRLIPRWSCWRELPCDSRVCCGNVDPIIWVLVIVLLFALTGRAQAPNPPDYSLLFDKTDVMIAARDGVKLHTEIYTPKNSTEPLPIIIERTPYGIADDDKGLQPQARALRRDDSRRLHFRLSGYPRPLRLRRNVCHAAPGS